MKNNILIISHYFPPIPGVGGRRWTKFVKYLCKKTDSKVYVISAKNKIKGVKSSFEKELASINFKHYTLPSNYPVYLERVDLKKITLHSKIMFRVQHYFIKKRVKGNYWDLSVFWEKHFKQTIPNIIKSEKINKLIISGPPFRYVTYASQLKIDFPELDIILDYRDPWNDFNNPKTFSKKRHEFEINLERNTLRKVDKIITVSDFQKTLIKEKEPNSAPIYVIPNGYDKDDYNIDPITPEKGSKINITHFGTLHFQKDYYWIPFFNAFEKLKIKHNDIYNQIDINLIGYCPQQIIDFISQKRLRVNITGMIPPTEAFEQLNKADIALWFKYDGSPGDFATKFGDYVAFKKYMWTFSIKGAVTSHIDKHRIGKVFYRDNKDLENEIYESFIGCVDRSKNQFNKKYNSSRLDISNLTDKLITVINN